MAHFSARILVLVSSFELKNTVSDLLKGQGFSIEFATDAFAALDILDANQFDLVIAETLLPGGLSSIDAVRCAKAGQPRLRALYLSNASEGRILDDRTCDDCISIPFHRGELLGCVWELLLRDLSTGCPASSERTGQRASLAIKVAGLRAIAQADRQIQEVIPARRALDYVFPGGNGKRAEYNNRRHRHFATQIYWPNSKKYGFDNLNTKGDMHPPNKSIFPRAIRTKPTAALIS